VSCAGLGWDLRALGLVFRQTGEKKGEGVVGVPVGCKGGRRVMCEWVSLSMRKCEVWRVCGRGARVVVSQRQACGSKRTRLGTAGGTEALLGCRAGGRVRSVRACPQRDRKTASSLKCSVTSSPKGESLRGSGEFAQASQTPRKAGDLDAVA